MAAETLKCPMCGASASTDCTQCKHCGSRLATIACPSCFGRMFRGAKFCSHCGAQAQRIELDSDEPHPCPRCAVETAQVLIGNTCFRECPKCEGIWADADSLNRIYNDNEQQTAILGNAADVPTSLTGNPIEVVRYLKCPVCGDLMHRVNFARCSHVVVDVCKAHGTWFDKDELRRIVEFIRSGGMQKARDMEIRELQRKRRDLELKQLESRTSWTDAPGWHGSRHDGWDIGLSTAASLLRTFVRGR